MNGEKSSAKVSLSTRLRAIPLIGIFLALLSAFCIATETLCVKLIHELSAVQLIVLRSLFAVTVYALYFLYKRQSIFAANGERLLLCIRCITGFIGVIFGFFAIRSIPLGDSSAIIYSSPVFVTLFARVCLKEACSIANCIAIVITVVGVVLISRPSFIFDTEDSVDEEHRLLGTSLAVGCAVFSALVFIILRKLQKTPAPLVVFYYSLTAVIIGSVMLAITGDVAIPRGLRMYLLLILMGSAGTFGQLFMTLAFKLEEAGPVSLTRSISMVIAFVYQVTILNEELIYTSVIGAAIVMVAVVIVALRKWYEKRPEIFHSLICCKKEDFEINKTNASTSIDCENQISIKL